MEKASLIALSLITTCFIAWTALELIARFLRKLSARKELEELEKQHRLISWESIESGATRGSIIELTGKSHTALRFWWVDNDFSIDGVDVLVALSDKRAFAINDQVKAKVIASSKKVRVVKCHIVNRF